MSSDSVVDERTMREIYLPAFEKAVKAAHPRTVMCAYNRVNGEYASQNAALLTELLRKEWGYGGCVMSDWGASVDRVKGIKAGLDLEMPGPNPESEHRVLEAVREGYLEEGAVDRAAEHVLNVVAESMRSAAPETPWEPQTQHAEARRLAGECMVLLKNEAGLLPLAPGERVAIIGDFAAAPRYQGGGSSHINSTRVDSLMEALAGLEGVAFAQGYELLDEQPKEALIAQAVALAGDAEKVVIVAGLPESFESEGFDRTHMRLPACQDELIRRVAEANPRTAVVLYNGSPVEMPWAEQVQGIVEAYLAGQAAGSATFDVLYGRVNPSGHLPETFPRRLEDNPSFLTYGGEADRVVYNEGVFAGYRYYDRKRLDVLFPFGHGLSYTTFTCHELTVSEESILDTDTVRVSVRAKNTGNRFGKAVVQLYVHPTDSRVFRPERELKGFEKLALAPGEEKTITFELNKRTFAYWSEQRHDWIVETGSYVLEVGFSSRNIVLTHNVFVKSTAKPLGKLSVNDVFEDLMQDTRAAARLRPLLQRVASDLDVYSDSPEAWEGIGSKMIAEMVRGMPLRCLTSYSGGRFTAEQLQALIDECNAE